MFQFLSKFVPLRRNIAIASYLLHENFGSLCFRNPLFHPKFISLTSNEQSFTASYLINTLGFSPQRAASVSEYLHLESREKPDLVIEFFENQGFSQAEALKAVRTCPKLFELDPEKNFLPKIEFLKFRGVKSSDIPGIIVANPNILTRSLEKHIVPCFDFFTNFLQCDEKFFKALKRFSGILLSPNAYVIHNIDLLRAEGVPKSHIVKLIERQPRALSRAPHQFRAFVEEVKEMGFKTQKATFVQAIWILEGISKAKLARKFVAFRRWGWTDHEILAAFQKFPTCMGLSEKTIEEKMDFFVNKMGCKSSNIARRPQSLGLSLDRRLIPRNVIIQVLLVEGLVTKLTLGPMFECSERIFMERYILHHEKEARELLKLYYAKLELPW